MRALLFSVIISLMLTPPLFGQIGIGASGGVHYPGLAESEQYDIRFRAGPGYGFFVRHDLLTLGGRHAFHARYQVKFFFNDTSLPNSGSTRYKFNEFSADVWMDLFSGDLYKIYAGISLNLLNVTGIQKYRNDYTGTNIMPQLLTGFEYKLTESYNFFSEIFIQIAEIDAGPEPLPIHGLGFMIGFTMFISE